jgi:hypothetical protein
MGVYEAEVLVCIAITGLEFYRSDDGKELLRGKTVELIGAKYGSDAISRPQAQLLSRSEPFSLRSFGSWISEASQTGQWCDLANRALEVLRGHTRGADLRGPLLPKLTVILEQQPDYILLNFSRVNEFFSWMSQFANDGGLVAGIEPRLSAGRWPSDGTLAVDPHVVVSITQRNLKPIDYGILTAIADRARTSLCQDGIAVRFRSGQGAQWFSFLHEGNQNKNHEPSTRALKEEAVILCGGSLAASEDMLDYFYEILKQRSDLSLDRLTLELRPGSDADRSEAQHCVVVRNPCLLNGSGLGKMLYGVLLKACHLNRSRKRRFLPIAHHSPVDLRSFRDLASTQPGKRCGRWVSRYRMHEGDILYLQSWHFKEGSIVPKHNLPNTLPYVTILVEESDVSSETGMTENRYFIPIHPANRQGVVRKNWLHQHWAFGWLSRLSDLSTRPVKKELPKKISSSSAETL